MIKHYEYTMWFFCDACAQHFTGILLSTSLKGMHGYSRGFTHPRCPYCGQVKNTPHVREEDKILYTGGKMTIDGYQSAVLEAGYSSFADGLIDFYQHREPDGMQYADPEWKSRR